MVKWKLKFFKFFKQQLLSPTILKHPDFGKPFILSTDGSDFALGAKLSQGKKGCDLTISYASKSLIKTTINKPIIEKQLLSTYWGINFFKHFLYGNKFIVFTDHRPLIYLFKHKNPSAKKTRIRMYFTIMYNLGLQNTNADGLSRISFNSGDLRQMNTSQLEINVMSITKSMSNKIELPMLPIQLKQI